MSRFFKQINHILPNPFNIYLLCTLASYAYASAEFFLREDAPKPSFDKANNKGSAGFVLVLCLHALSKTTEMVYKKLSKQQTDLPETDIKKENLNEVSRDLSAPMI